MNEGSMIKSKHTYMYINITVKISLIKIDIMINQMIIYSNITIRYKLLNK